MILSEEKWLDSQKHELGFWQKELKINNLDQAQRNKYYLSKMEGKCDLIKRFVESTDLKDKVVMDLGSGPQGILHVLDCKIKIAVDPLMDKFREIGYNIGENGVNNYTMKAEEISSEFSDSVDVIFCLNSIDHHQNPKLVVEECSKCLKKGGHLILLTDTRLESQLDDYHKLPITVDYVDTWLSGEFLILEKQVFPHGVGNPILQYIVHAMKE